MRYKMMLEKGRTHYWDETSPDSCQFNASSDGVALAFACTIVEQMNRAWRRIDEPRLVHLVRLERLEENGYADKAVQVDLSDRTLLKGFREIRRALEAFYPKKQGGRGCMMHMFTDWKPFRHPHSRVA